MGLAFESFPSLLSYSARTVQEWWHLSRCSAQRTCAHALDRAGLSLKNLERGNVTRSVWAQPQLLVYEVFFCRDEGTQVIALTSSRSGGGAAGTRLTHHCQTNRSVPKRPAG